VKNDELDSLVRSYARLSRDVGGRINFALDSNSDGALSSAEREKVHLDQAFFVLSFAALENQVTSLACGRIDAADRKTAMRDASFERRWDAAVSLAKDVLRSPPPWAVARSAVLSWYKIRSDIAHGQAPSELADVPTIIYQADEIAQTFELIKATLNKP
jgi:hypothetical protein